MKMVYKRFLYVFHKLYIHIIVYYILVIYAVPSSPLFCSITMLPFLHVYIIYIHIIYTTSSGVPAAQHSTLINTNVLNVYIMVPIFIVFIYCYITWWKSTQSQALKLLFLSNNFFVRYFFLLCKNAMNEKKALLERECIRAHAALVGKKEFYFFYDTPCSCVGVCVEFVVKTALRLGDTVLLLLFTIFFAFFFVLLFFHSCFYIFDFFFFCYLCFSFVRCSDRYV